ncbi:hypothetical protein ACFRH4_31020 [Streptomyces mirabilis]|uniref:hypothetical protein n=1 Tax=Streptomyces mirabilis TaxID=68239 RepID=UPI0036C0604B
MRHADVLADVDSDDEFEVGLNALITGLRALIPSSRSDRVATASLGRRRRRPECCLP